MGFNSGFKGLMFMGSLHRNNILVYNPNQMHKSNSLFYLTTALRVSGVTITHLQEHKTTVTTASGNRYSVIDRVKFYYRSSLSVKFNSIYYSVTVTRCCSYSCFVLLTMGDSETRNMQSSSQTKINSVTCASCWDLYTRICTEYQFSYELYMQQNMFTKL